MFWANGVQLTKKQWFCRRDLVLIVSTKFTNTLITVLFYIFSVLPLSPKNDYSSQSPLSCFYYKHVWATCNSSFAELWCLAHDDLGRMGNGVPQGLSNISSMCKPVAWNNTRCWKRLCYDVLQMSVGFFETPFETSENNRTWMFCFTSALCSRSVFWTPCTALRGLNGQSLFCAVVGGRGSRCRTWEAFNGLQQSRPNTSDSKKHEPMKMQY